MGGVFAISLGVIFLLFCWRDFEKNNPSKQNEGQLKDLQTEESTQ